MDITTHEVRFNNWQAISTDVIKPININVNGTPKTVYWKNLFIINRRNCKNRIRSKLHLPLDT